jgi:hypothetical protein
MKPDISCAKKTGHLHLLRTGFVCTLPGDARSRSHTTASAFFGFCHQLAVGFFAVNRLHAPAFQIGAGASMSNFLAFAMGLS